MLAGLLEVTRGLRVVALVTVMLGQQARGVGLLAEILQHLRRARRVPALLVQRRCLLLVAVLQRDLGGRNPQPAPLEDGLRLGVLAGAAVEVARHPHQLARLGLARGIARRGAGRFLDDHLVETLGRLLPLAALDVGLGGVAREIRLRVAVAGAAEVPGLLEHLGGHALVARLEVGLGGALVLPLLAEDAPRGVELAALQVELRALEEAILVVADLCRADVLLALDEVARGFLEQTAGKAVLGGIQGGAALGEHRGLTARLAQRARIGLRPLVARGVLRLAAPLPAAGEQRRDQQQQARGREPEARDRAVQEGVDGHREVFVEAERFDRAGHGRRLVHEPARDAHRGVVRRIAQPERDGARRQPEHGGADHEPTAQPSQRAHGTPLLSGPGGTGPPGPFRIGRWRQGFEGGRRGWARAAPGSSPAPCPAPVAGQARPHGGNGSRGSRRARGRSRSRSCRVPSR